MALTPRGFEVTNIPRAQGIDFSLQPGQFSAGLNSGIGAFNAFSNIAEEVRDRPLRNRERESRLAQIESEAQLAPVRRQLTEIQLARAGLPEDIVTGSTAIRVPRAGAPGQYDLVQQTEGFTFDPTTGARTPFQRAGKLLTSAEELADQQAMRDVQRSQIQATAAKAAADGAYRAENLEYRKQQQTLTQEKFVEAKKRADERAKLLGITHVVGEVDGVLYSTFGSAEDGVVARFPLGVAPLRNVDFVSKRMNNQLPEPSSIIRGQPAPANGNPPPPAPRAQAAPVVQPVQKIGIGVLDSFDENGNSVTSETAVTYDANGLPIFPVAPAAPTPILTSKGYRVIPRQ